MKELLEKITELAKLPYSRYGAELELAIGSIGLWMNAAFGKLSQMKAEFSHAFEYLKANRHSDIQETLKGYEEILKKIREQLCKKAENLAQCSEHDDKEKVLDFIESFQKKVEALEHDSHMDNCESCTEEMIAKYQSDLEALHHVCGEYIKLHIGDLSRLDSQG